MSQLAENTFRSEIFAGQLRDVDLAGTRETVLDGSRRNFEGVAQAFEGVGRVGVIGWSSQGPAQAQNLRETFRAVGADTQVVVGLRNDSPSRAKAEAAGFTTENGTLMTVEEALGRSGMSLLLIADAAMARHGHELIDLARPGSTIGLSHGFYVGHLGATDRRLRKDVNVIGVCPKGMGPSVRGLYEQGSGINASFAVEQGGPEARDLALAWALGIGAPYTFQTTLGKEWRSDVYGERSILLGGVHGIVEALYAWKREHRVDAADAYIETVESLVGPISRTISQEGLQGVMKRLRGGEREQFIQAYNAAYPVLENLNRKIYGDVSSGRELAEVVSDDNDHIAMSRVDGSGMWRVGERVRQARDERWDERLRIDPTVAGIYVAGMMAQVDTLRNKGHYWSEVVNESIIEAVDSLNPFMQARGVAYMVDNCSVTARRGSRKWAPIFRAQIGQDVLPIIDGTRPPKDTRNYYEDFTTHDVHQALRVLGQMRPPVDIAVS